MRRRGPEASVRVEASEGDTLVADQTGLAIDRMRVTALDLEVRGTVLPMSVRLGEIFLGKE